MMASIIRASARLCRLADCAQACRARRRTRPASRRARTTRTRSTCSRSSDEKSGVGITGAAESSVNLFTPTMTRLAALDAELILVRAASDLILEERRADRLRRAAQPVDTLEQRERAVARARRERLDVVAAGERIDSERRARLVRDDLLRSQRERRGLGGRERERLVVAVGVQRLRAAEHRRERLHRDANHIVQRLLRLERDAAGLRVEPQAAAARRRR